MVDKSINRSVIKFFLFGKFAHACAGNSEWPEYKSRIIIIIHSKTGGWLGQTTGQEGGECESEWDNCN